jgi:hypothetical protein
MAFTIPNLGAASHDDQAFPNQADIDALTAGVGGNGVTSGCLVTPQGSPNMTVHVAAGVLTVGTSAVSVSAGDVALTSAASNPRRDLIVSNLSGTLSAIAGTPVAVVPSDPSIVPVLPTLPSDRIALAAVDVPANTTTITAAEIIDKRVLLSSGVQTVSVNIAKSSDSIVSSTTYFNDPDFVFTLPANSTWTAQIYMDVSASSSGGWKMAWTLPSGCIGTWRDTSGEINDSRSFVAIGTEIQHPGFNNNTLYMVMATIRNGSTAGTAQFKYAQIVASGSMIVRHDGMLKADRVS